MNTGPTFSYTTPPSWPGVSIVMAAGGAVASDTTADWDEIVDRLLAQEYPGELELVVAVSAEPGGPSSTLRALARSRPQLVVVSNPSGRVSSGVNAGVFAASNPLIVRAGMRGALPPGYVKTAVAALLATGAVCVGGTQAPSGHTHFQQAVATAMTSRLGVGGARFHIGGSRGPTRTVYLGAYRRADIERLGGFDDHYEQAFDWELNYRLRRAGGTIWFEPMLRIDYEAHRTIRGLSRAYYGAGRARREIIRHYPETTSARYLAAPAAMIALVVGVIACSLGAVFGWAWLAIVGTLPLCGYALGVLVGALATGSRLDWRARSWLPFVVMSMHVSWGSGFLLGTAPRPATTTKA